MSTDFIDIDEAPAVPRMFHQLGILILDGSGSMSEATLDKISKAEAVNLAVRELLGRLKASRVAANFSIAVVTFDDKAILHTPPTPVTTIDDYADYDPLKGHSDGTDIGVGLRQAGEIARRFLTEANTESVPRSVVLVVMSDGMSGGDPVSEANALKQDPKITLCTTLLRAAASSNDADVAEQLLRNLASSPAYYRTTYRSEDLRKFFIASVSAGKNVKIA
jgi:uncharacterized protein YegL